MPTEIVEPERMVGDPGVKILLGRPPLQTRCGPAPAKDPRPLSRPPGPFFGHDDQVFDAGHVAAVNPDVSLGKAVAQGMSVGVNKTRRDSLACQVKDLSIRRELPAMIFSLDPTP